MNLFERAMNLLFGGLALLENDPGFGYRIYRLKGEDQARIFRLSRQKKAANDEPPPTKGVFVAVTRNPSTGDVIIAYGQFPKDGGESQYLAALNYKAQELNKAPLHIARFLTYGKVPVADNEFADET